MSSPYALPGKPEYRVPLKLQAQLEPRYQRPDYRQRKAQGAAQGTEGLDELRAVGEFILRRL